MTIPSPEEHRTATTSRGRTPPSRPDRAAIAARSSRNHTPFVVESIPWLSINILSRIWSTIDARSWSDRGRSWSTTAIIVVKMKQKSWPIRGKSWSCDVAPRNRSHDPCRPPPWSPPLPTFSGLIPSLKACISPLLFFNFWSTREEIKRVSRKVLSSRDPLLPRVWRRSYWTMIITISPLDFIEFFPWIPNVHEEESEQIRFNPRELRPHSCGNRVSSEVRSIIKR